MTRRIFFTDEAEGFFKMALKLGALLGRRPPLLSVSVHGSGSHSAGGWSTMIQQALGNNLGDRHGLASGFTAAPENFFLPHCLQYSP